MTTSKQNTHYSRLAQLFGLLLALSASVALSARADTFTAPSPDELSMKSLPGYPGAPAVILFEEEDTNDDLHVHLYYMRIKVLTEDGKKYANVELPFYSNQGEYGANNQIANIEGRTIHADGSIVPFTGKPYLKTIEKGTDFKVQERIFTLPDVEVGSIIEYRYALRYDDNFFEAPNWYIQQELFVKSAHYIWHPTTRDMIDTDVDAPVNAIAWFPVLPPGVEVKPIKLAASDAMGVQKNLYEITLKDIPPTVEEDYMPPVKSFTYRVLFSFTAFRDGREFWKVKGKKWSKRADTFIGPSNDLRDATRAVIGDATTQDQKLRKIYAAVMTVENTAFTREHDSHEDKATGLAKVTNSFDVWKNKRGSSDQITMLFIGMARAAGMKAYYMAVTSRRDSLFVSAWLNFGQLESTMAIVNVDGKDMFFDPGSRYMPYGHLTWDDTFASGIRQTDNGTDFANAPGESYTNNQEGRSGNFTLDEQGNVTGKLNISYTGDPALTWRQRALSGDVESLRHALKTSMEERLPSSLRIELANITNLEDYEKPLEIEYSVKGSLGNVTGKRIVLPVDVFVAESKPSFTHETRTQSVYFHYPWIVRDATRINFPSTLSIEAAPSSSKTMFQKRSAYQLDITPASTNITVRRTFIMNDIMVNKEEYPELRTYYQQFEAKDHDSVVLKTSTASASVSSPTTEAAH